VFAQSKFLFENSSSVGERPSLGVPERDVSRSGHRDFDGGRGTFPRRPSQ